MKPEQSPGFQRFWQNTAYSTPNGGSFWKLMLMKSGVSRPQQSWFNTGHSWFTTIFFLFFCFCFCVLFLRFCLFHTTNHWIPLDSALEWGTRQQQCFDYWIRTRESLHGHGQTHDSCMQAKKKFVTGEKKKKESKISLIALVTSLKKENRKTVRKKKCSPISDIPQSTSSRQ